MNPKWWVLAAVACGTFMATLDSSIVNIALPTLTKVLSSDLVRMKWVVVTYLLVITCMLLPLGKFSDQRGRKLVFQTGFGTFILGSTLCGFAQSLGALVAFRVIQALGAAMLMANGPAIITSTFVHRDRGAALGTLAMAASLGLVAGPSLGGFLITYFGWQSIFLLNFPVGIIGIYFVHRYVKNSAAPKVKQKFDWAGAILQSLVLLLTMVIFDPPHISISGGMPYAIPRPIMALVILALLVAFIQVESQVKYPLFDLGLLRNRVFWSANLASFLIFIAYSSFLVLMPFFLEVVLGFPPQKAGIFMTAIPLTVFVVAPISGRLSDRYGSLELCFTGALTGMLGLLFMAGFFGRGIGEGSDDIQLILGLCSMGLATGLFQSPNNNTIMTTVPAQKLSLASAFLATIRNLGLVIGTGLSTSLFSATMTATGNFMKAFRTSLTIASIFCGAAMLITLVQKKRTRH